MKSQLLSIFNFSSWYGQKNCIKTIYIYIHIKIFYYQKQKQKKKHTIRARNGNIQLCKKKYMSVTLINFIDRSWCTSAPHKTREQTSWSKVRPRDYIPQNVRYWSQSRLWEVCQSPGHATSPPPDKLPWNVNILGRPIVTSQRTVVQNTKVFFVQRSIVSCFEHKVLKLQV